MRKRSIIDNLPPRTRFYSNHNCCGNREFKSVSFLFSRCGSAVYSGFRQLGIVRENRGQALLTLILVMVPLTFLVFSPIFYDNQMDLYDKAKAKFYAYLDRIQVEGYLTTQDENAMLSDFDTINCPIDEIDCPRESQGDSRVLRNDSVTSSLITVRIKCKPENKGLSIGGLVGAGAPGDYYINLKGSVISERVDP